MKRPKQEQRRLFAPHEKRESDKVEPTTIPQKGGQAHQWELALHAEAISNSLNEIYLFDGDSLRICFANQAALKNLGYSQEEIRKVKVLEIYSGFTQAEFRLLVRPLAMHQQPDLTFETLHRRADGSSYPTEVHLQLLEREGERFFLAMVRNITDRKWVETNLQESEEKYRILFELMSDALFLIDNSDGQILDANKAAEALYGYSRNELLCTRNVDLSAQPDQTRQATVTGLNKVPVRYHRKKDGTVFPVEITATHLTWNGRLAHIPAIRDITDRLQAEQALRQSEERMRYIIRHDPNAIAVFDRELRYIAVSERYLQDYDVKQQNILGKHHYEIFPEMPLKWKEVHQRVLMGATERSDDDYFERPDGTITYNRWECRPWYDAEGGIGGMITYTEVTTERKLAQEKLKESEANFRALFEHMAQGAVFQNADYQITLANPAALRILGLTLEQIQGRTSIDPRWRAVHEDGSDFPGETHPSVLALQTGKAVANVIMGVFNPQLERYKWINVNATPQFRPGEDLPHQVYITFEDITVQKQNEMQLKEQLEELRRWQAATIGREMRMLELKGEVNQLLQQAGLPARYSSVDPELVNG